MTKDEAKTPGPPVVPPVGQPVAAPAAEPATAPARRRRWRHPLLWLLGFAALVGVLVVIGLGLTGRVIAAPRWVVERVEMRANAALQGVVTARIGGIELVVDPETFAPHTRLRGVELFAPSGARIAVMPDVRATLYSRPLLEGKIIPRSISMYGTQVAMRRLADGSLDLAFGSGMAPSASALDPAGVMKAIDDAFALPLLSGVESITVEGLDARLQDVRSGQVWAAEGSWLAFSQTADRLTIDTGFSFDQAGGAGARLQLAIASDKRSSEATLRAAVTDVRARDLALQTPALAWLGALDAPISGALSTGIDAEGRLQPLRGALELGAGALQPTADTKPVRFDAARLELAYDPATHELDFPDLRVDSKALHVSAAAKGWLKGMETGFPDALVAQVRISELEADPDGLFADPVKLTEGMADLRIGLAPFRVDLGQLVLVDGARRISAKGKVTAAPEGWAVAVDVAVNAIESGRLFALWPVAAVPKTRAWLIDNVATSELFDVNAALRIRPGEEPRFMLGYEFRDTDVRIMRYQPLVQGGRGYSVIDGYRYTLVVDEGHLTAPEGGRVDVGGTVLQIPDFRIKPAPAKITLRTESSITAAMSIMDQPPFQFLTKAQKPVDLAEGRARVTSVISLPLMRKPDPRDIDYQVTGDLTSVSSDKIVPGRPLRADHLRMAADRTELTISGSGTLSGVPASFTWRQGLTPAERGKSQVAADVEVSQQMLDAFNIALPRGSVGGKGRAKIDIALARGKPAEFSLTSDLAGVTLAVPQIGYSKPARQSARFAIRGRFTQPVEVDAMALKAPGLSAAGRLRLQASGALDLVRLSSVAVGDWFKGAVDIRGTGAGRPVAVAVNGGTLDLRRATFGGGPGGGPLGVQLDRLQVTGGIALTGLSGNFSTAGGLSGDFAGKVNGGPPVTGTVTPERGRSAVRLRAGDAGAAIRAAGIFSRGVGGRLDLALHPRAGAGQYDGEVSIADFRVVDLPVLASLLDAISVVGLIDQLNGSGILFSDVRGNFRLTPGTVVISDSSAVGASVGISAAGVYRTASSTLDVQGTVSPVYLLNGIGQIVSRRREGLIGVNYRLTGPAASPAIGVNPLSILTPGFIRDIFRSDPPGQ